MKIEDVIQTTFKTNKQKAIVNIRYTSNYLNSLQNMFMLEFDLSMPQFNILRILRGANTAINVRTVKERMIEKSPNSTRLMDKLVLKNLIIRTNCKNDKRVVFVEISEDGLALLSKIDLKMDVDFIESDNLTEEEAETLSFLLDKLRG